MDFTSVSKKEKNLSSIRHPDILTRKDTVLLIIDVQEKLALVMEEKNKIIKNIKKLISLSHVLNLSILVTEQYSKGIGHLILPLKEAIAEYYPIEKVTFSCFDEESFVKELDKRKAKNLIITGMEAHICILQTALNALCRGYKVHLPNDAVCSRQKNDWKVGIDKMRKAGVIITSTETVIFELLEKANTPEFRTMLKVIK